MADATPSFPITTLPGAPLSTHVLKNELSKRFRRRMPEGRQFCESLLDRLNAIHDTVALHEDKQWKTKFCELLKRFVRLPRQAPLLERLAYAETNASTFEDLNAKLDVICDGVGQLEAKEQWIEDWENDRIFQVEELNRRARPTAARLLIKDMGDEKKVTTAMLDMYTSLQVNATGPLAQLKRAKLEDLRVHLGLETRVITSDTVEDIDQQPSTILSIFQWYIPEKDVELEGDLLGSGTYGNVNCGKWTRRDGTIQDVIVKTLFVGSEMPFLKQLQFWYELPQHPNVVKLYGGCHLAKEPFFVCENARGGDIGQFFTEKENRGMFWSIFLQVAEGLKFLHAHHIVHGRLKGSNILLSKNGTPKILDFGASTYVQTLSVALSKKRLYAFQQAVRWKAREELIDTGTQRHLNPKSDIYSLGMTMIEALTQNPPFGMYDDDEVIKIIMDREPYRQPPEISDEEWSVISRLVAVDIEDRPSIDEVIMIIRKHCEQQSSFPIKKLGPSRKVLAILSTKCGFMPERETLCRQVLDRLEFLHDAVCPVSVKDVRKQQYVDVVLGLVKLVSTTQLLLRLARFDSFCETIHHLQCVLTEIGKNFDLDNTAEMMKWSHEWDNDCVEQRKKLAELVTAASDTALVSELRGEEGVEGALTLLKHSMNRPEQFADMLKLKQVTFTRLMTFRKQAGLRMFNWFIDAAEITYDGRVSKSEGSFGDVSLGTWLNSGQPRKVAAKHLFKDIASITTNAFLDQLGRWWSLPRNKNILELYGGSHIMTPPLYVCEYAAHGNLRDFLSDGKHHQLLWPTFLQVAEGLKFLQQHRITHGNLKCSNILVDENQNAKIGDFGFNKVRMLSASISRKGGHANSESVRWKPPEILATSDREQAWFESDIYSLGMCMIEAITQVVPFSKIDEDNVLSFIKAGNPYQKPANATDNAWEFISRMCAYNPRKRPTIEVVIEKIKDLIAQRDETRVAEKREISNVASIADKCADCGVMRIDSEQYCRQCGFHLRVLKSPDDEAILCYLKRPEHRHNRIAHAWRKAFEAAVALQSLHEQNIFHGNLKPTNIRVGFDGRAKLVGFQLSGIVDKLNQYSTENLDEAFRWQAPQILAGSKPSLRSDLYSFAMCIIAMVSFEPPWGINMSDSGIKEKVLSKRELPPYPSSFIDEQRKLITDMLLDENETIGEVVQKLKVHAHENSAPEWAISKGNVVITGEVFSQSRFVSRRKGLLLGARVAVEKLEASFVPLNRSSQSVVDMWFQLRHPNIIQLLGAVKETDSHAFVSEYARDDLAACLQEEPVSPRYILEKLLGVAYALRYMHASGIIHGDVSSLNVFVTRSGATKLSGFVLSCSVSTFEKQREDGGSCQAWVSPSYVCWHERTFASDVFWFGKLIVDAVTGSTQPTNEHDLCDECASVVQVQAPSFTSVEWNLVSDMCCRDSQSRISMAEVVHRLVRLVAVNGFIDSDMASTLNQRDLCQQQLLYDLHQSESPDCADSPHERGTDSDTDTETDWSSTSYSKAACLSSKSCDYSLEEVSRFQQKCLPHQPSIEFLVKNCAVDLLKKGLSAANCTSSGVARKRTVEEVGRYAGLPNGLVLNYGSHSDGGFGVVQQGRWFGAPVAVKTMKSDQLAKLRASLEEINIWSSLRHPHIVHFFGACTQEYYAIVSDFAKGGQINEYLKDESKYLRVWELLHDAALGLQWLHFRGIVHADLKCDNIVIAEDNQAKLIDFGLSRVHNCKGLMHSAVARWQPPESLKKEVLTFGSDLYSLGMCIIEALTGAFPWGNSLEPFVKREVIAGRLPRRPKCFSLTQWELVKRMCCSKSENRLKIEVVVRVLGFFANRSPYTDDKSLETSLAGWVREGASKDMKEHEQMCLHIFDRLNRIYQVCQETVADQFPTAKERLRLQYDEIMANFSTFLLNRTSNELACSRLANSRKIDEKIASFHDEIDKLEKSFSDLLTGSRQEQTGLIAWKQQFDVDRRTKLAKMKTLVETEEELNAVRHTREVLVMLKFELDHKTDNYKDDIAKELLRLMERTLERLEGLSDATISAVPDWFIPRGDVDFDAGDTRTCSLFHGMWFEGFSNGGNTNVLINCVEILDKFKEDFCKEVGNMCQLAHPHVLKIVGACHVGWPTFLVCEDAAQGSFKEVFKKDKSQLWRLFYQAALGLEFLHSKKVVHGNLKGSNLLVDTENKTKLCNYGLSYLREGVRSLRLKEAIHWMAPERLTPPNANPSVILHPSFASDVFSLGMCIIEAVHGELPYGNQDTTAAIRSMLNKPYPRPLGLKDDEWALVEKLLHPDLTKRMSLTDAIVELKVFADREEEEISETVETSSEVNESAVCGDHDALKSKKHEQDVQRTCNEY